MNETHALLQTLTKLGLEYSEETVPTLLNYQKLVLKWNKFYNLTATRSPSEFFTRHLIDCVTLAPHIIGNNIIDVGSGSGLPGIPLAILFPEKQFTLLDSNGKKTRFLTQAKIELGLNNVRVVHSRVEKYQEHTYDALVTRAFSSIEETLSLLEHLRAQNGVYYLMKGNLLEQELQSVPDGYHSSTLKLENEFSSESFLVKLTSIEGSE